MTITDLKRPAPVTGNYNSTIHQSLSYKYKHTRKREKNYGETRNVRLYCYQLMATRSRILVWCECFLSH